MKEEERTKVNKEETKVAFKAQAHNSRSKNVTCAFCKKFGHHISDCRKRLNKNSKSDQSSSLNCNKCQRTNHSTEDCYVGKTFPLCKHCRRTNHPDNKCLKKSSNDSRRENGNNNKAVFFTSASVGGKSPDTEFICDSGCTAHMTRE